MSTAIATEAVETELLPPADDKLVKYAGQTGLEKPATKTLVEAFHPIYLKAREAIKAAEGVAASVKDATCVTEIRKARKCRLELRAVRLESEATRKKQKESALLFGRAVDGFHNILMADLSPVETALQEAEDTAERMEAERKTKLKAERESELRPLLDTPIIGDLAELTEAEWQVTVANAKLLKQAKVDAAKKAEEDRIAREKAEAEEKARITAENERLRKEADEQAAAARAERARLLEESIAAAEKARQEREAIEAKAKAEREEAERKLKAERAAAVEAARVQEDKARKEREAAEAEARKLREAIEARAQAEAAEKEKQRVAAEEEKARVAKQLKADEAARKKAAAAPDKAKLIALADVVAHIETPTLNDSFIYEEVTSKIRDLASWLAEKAQSL